MTADWRRSTRCSSESACVEVAIEPGRVQMRNSQRPDAVVEFDADEWATFLNGVTEGEFRAPQ